MNKLQNHPYNISKNNQRYKINTGIGFTPKSEEEWKEFKEIISNQYNTSENNQRNKINVEIDFIPKNDEEWDEFESAEKYKALLTNLYTNSIEFDKLLLVLAVGLLGFIITLLIGMNFEHKNEIYNLPYILQKIAFVFGAYTVILSIMTIHSLIKVFELNSKYYKIKIKDDFTDADLEEETILRSKLDVLDQKAKDYFFCAICMIGVYISLILAKNILIGISNG